jgi:hypothetical protein
VLVDGCYIHIKEINFNYKMYRFIREEWKVLHEKELLVRGCKFVEWINLAVERLSDGILWTRY